MTNGVELSAKMRKDLWFPIFMDAKFRPGMELELILLLAWKWCILWS